MVHLGRRGDRGNRLCRFNFGMARSRARHGRRIDDGDLSRVGAWLRHSKVKRAGRSREEGGGGVSRPEAQGARFIELEGTATMMSRRGTRGEVFAATTSRRRTWRRRCSNEAPLDDGKSAVADRDGRAGAQARVRCPGAVAERRESRRYRGCGSSFASGGIREGELTSGILGGRRRRWVTWGAQNGTGES